jgi:serine/threonine protein kinase
VTLSRYLKNTYSHGVSLAKYKKMTEIGKGSFGVVDLVEDAKGHKWAMKTFTPPTLPDVTAEELRARFEREVRYQLQIDHPNVVKIVDFDLNAHPPWFVMELATCSLADELRADRTLGGDPRKPLFDILSGLEAIHEKGYKHRDLKPANVLKFISANGSVRYAISDFGLMSPETGLTSTLTASNTLRGRARPAPSLTHPTKLLRYARCELRRLACKSNPAATAATK